jgi:S1-C subfamily serine protease
VTPRRALAVLAAACALGALALTGGATAAPVESPITGIVDIYTNLAYQGAAAAGTGIVVTSGGVVLTNNHVIRGATTIKAVDLDNGRTYKAKVLGYALGADVAAIQLQSASGLTTAPLGRSNNLHVGDSVTTLGNAGGAGGTPHAATGKIIGLGRSITARDDTGNSERLTGLIETDAALQPGDSGGPMVDGSGHVIGMDTAASTSFTFESSASRGYAVPIDRAAKIVTQIVGGHEGQGVHVGGTAFMGVSVRDAGPFEFGQVTSGAGVVVAQVIAGTPVARVGLSPGDVLTRFDGKTVGTPAKLTSLVVTKHPGDTVEIRWVDQDGTAHTANVRLAAGPPQ